MDKTGELHDIEVRSSTIHGTGLFALRDLEPGRRLIEYVGRKITKEESVRLCSMSNAYIFTLTEDTDLDGSVEWNMARFINHSCDPNCEALQEEDDRIWIYACKPIPKGAELSFNYGYDLEEFREHPCQCQSANCLGYMVAEELFPIVRSQLTGACD